MTCPDKELLSAFADGELASSEAHGVEDHLKECGRCRSRVKTLRALKAAVSAAAPSPAMPEDLRRVLQGMAARPAASGWKRFFHELGAGWAGAATAAAFSLAAVLAVVWVVRQRPPDRQEELPLEMLLAAHNQYARTMPLAPEEGLVAGMPEEEGPDAL
jgi:anti-sigma factor RsiW